MTRLTERQIDLLLQRIHPKRVLNRDGNSYVEAHDIKAELIRVFGFANFDSEVVEQVCLFDVPCQTKAGKDAFNVAYRSVVRLTVKAEDGTPLATYTEGHVGESTHPVRAEAHGNALTNSESYALKRCAVFLGDQFGLSLYNKGSLASLVRWTLQRPQTDETDKPTDESTDERDVPDVHPESTEVEQEPDPRETNAKPAQQEQVAASGEQPAEPDPAEREAQRKQVEADRIRQAALNPPPDDWTGTPVRWISHLMGEAVKHKCQNIPVESLLSSGAVALRVMLEQRMKLLADEARVAS